MSRTYAQLIDLVRNWANRDQEVLPNTIVADCLRYAADKAYRTLRIPPLEHNVLYTAAQLQANTVGSNNRFGSVTELCIPDDLIEFIYIRGIDSGMRTTRMFNEKADIRTFYDIYAEKYSDFAFWSRHGNNILLSPGFGNTGTNFGSTGVGNEECIELHYFRRLPALNAFYDVSAANASVQLNTIYTMNSELPSVVTTTSLNADPTVTNNVVFLEELPTGTLYRTTNIALDATFSDTQTATHTVATTVCGNIVPNWLRDENERVLLMGALAEVFFYLQENEESLKYAQLFQQEIDELNKEDQMRHASGGNVQVNFNGRGLI